MRLILWSLLLASFIYTPGATAQVNSMSEGMIYLGQNGAMAIFGTHKFSGTIVTHRGEKPGMVIFTSKSGWLDASDEFNVDGYVKTFKEGEFTYPIGHEYNYRPISLSMASKSLAAFFYKDPNYLGLVDDERIKQISNTEYWHIILENESQITLSWVKESLIDELTDGKLNRLSIMGLQDGIWKIIPSVIDDKMLDPKYYEGRLDNKECDIFQGSISTVNNILPGTYQYFSLGSIASDIRQNDLNLSVFPNPQFTEDQVKINYTIPEIDGKAMLRLFKSDNSLIFETALNENSGTFDFSRPYLESGLYIVSLTSASGKTAFQNLLLVEE